MDEDTRLVMRIGCGCVLLALVISALVWSGLVYGIIAIIHAAQH